MSPQRGVAELGSLLIATHAMVTACEGKLSLAGRTGFLLRHLHQIPWSFEVSPSTRMSICHTSQIAVQVVNRGGLRCCLSTGSCRRSSDAMTMILWQSQIDDTSLGVKAG